MTWVYLIVPLVDCILKCLILFTCLFTKKTKLYQSNFQPKQVFRYIQSTGSSGGASTDTPGQGDSTAVTKPQPSQKSSISLVVILVVIAMVVVLVVSGLAWVFFGGRRRG